MAHNIQVMALHYGQDHSATTRSNTIDAVNHCLEYSAIDID
ncbi:hypothetical protein MGSAQ_002621 [marine sediment metagenome]|uniref:Uncharacterized protein n=1 Tax=marine sediment metagenome TaxID=412755 RepID=A0A1B6NQY0_9ZZZZ